MSCPLTGRTDAAVFRQTGSERRSEDTEEPPRRLQQKEKPSSGRDLKVQVSHKETGAAPTQAQHVDVPMHAPGCARLRRVRPKANAEKSSMHTLKRPSLHAAGFAVFQVGVGPGVRYVGEQHLMFAVH